MHRATLVAVAVIALLASAAPAPALHVEHFEDLARSKLPNGLVELPVRGSPKARRAGGYILRFSDASLQVSPLDGQDTGRADFEAIRGAILQQKTGDLYYMPAPSESLLAWSGRIAEIGRGFLFELSGKELPRPPAAFSKRGRDGKTSKGYPGRVDVVRIDGRYLVETIAGRYALVRVLEKAPSFVVLQWVYQPSGARVFEIPKRRLLPYKPRATLAERMGYAPRLSKRPEQSPGVPSKGHQGAVSAAAFPEGAVTHLRHREALAKELIRIVENKDGSAARSARGFAAEALGRMRAPEAAPVLASLINAPLPHSATHPDPVRPSMGIMYGAVPALVRIGKPGARACLEALCRLTPQERQKTSKPRLLCRVIVQVEGKAVALLLIRKMLENAQDEQARENLRLALELVEEGKVPPAQSPTYRTPMGAPVKSEGRGTGARP